MQDKIFRVLLILSAVVIPIIGGGIVYSLTADASGAFEHFGFWNFIFSDDWVTTAGKESYGALPFITGTLLTTILALLMCIPFSLPVALFTGEYFRGKKIAAVLGTVTDLLAGIPSIIYGLWGFYVLRNVFMHLKPISTRFGNPYCGFCVGYYDCTLCSFSEFGVYQKWFLPT